jgi:dsRNA-specific ribonuclease
MSFWLAERNTRLEFLGDALAREIASRIVYHSFPDLASGGISTAASHLTTNDTFGFLYELSGMETMRVSLARELLGEAVERERQRVGVSEARKGLSAETTEILEVDLQDLDQAGKAVSTP